MQGYQLVVSMNHHVRGKQTFIAVFLGVLLFLELHPLLAAEADSVKRVVVATMEFNPDSGDVGAKLHSIGKRLEDLLDQRAEIVWITPTTGQLSAQNLYRYWLRAELDAVGNDASVQLVVSEISDGTSILFRYPIDLDLSDHSYREHFAHDVRSWFLPTFDLLRSSNGQPLVLASCIMPDSTEEQGTPSWPQENARLTRDYATRLRKDPRMMHFAVRGLEEPQEIFIVCHDKLNKHPLTEAFRYVVSGEFDRQGNEVVVHVFEPHSHPARPDTSFVALSNVKGDLAEAIAERAAVMMSKQ